ncbi:restriction endonuclease subunit S, partial [Pedobacter psychroterrae]
GVGVGKVFHYTNGKIGVHQRVYILSEFNEVIGKYLFYYFSSKFNDRVSKLSAKNSVDSVRYDMIAKMSLMFPSIKEQSRIANILPKAK